MSSLYSSNYIPPLKLSPVEEKSILIRGVTPTDKQHFREGIKRLSDRSVYYRFHKRSFTLSERRLNYLTNIDQFHHMAIGVLGLNEGQETGIAVGRYIRNTTNSEQAEIALTVIDEYQRQGIGAVLMAILSTYASFNNIQVFTMYMHAERRGLLKALKTIGSSIIDMEAGIVEIHLPVALVKSKITDISESRYYKEFLEVFPREK